jgi:membrane protein
MAETTTTGHTTSQPGAAAKTAQPKATESVWSFDSLRYLVTETFKEWRDDSASRLAAALSYYTVFSLPPLLVISLAIAGQFYDRQAAQSRLLDQAGQLLGQTGGRAIADILENASDPTLGSLAAIISLFLLFFGATGVFNELQASLNQIWEVEAKPSRGIWGVVQDRLFSFTLVLAVGFLLLVSLVLTTVLAGISEYVFTVVPAGLTVVRVVNFVVSLLVFTVLFALIFKIIPDVKIQWRDVWLGALVTAVLFSIGKWAIGVYLGQSAPASAYGAAGSIIVLLLWIYYSAQILFFGAEFTQVYANRFGGHIRADDDAVALVD